MAGKKSSQASSSSSSSGDGGGGSRRNGKKRAAASSSTSDINRPMTTRRRSARGYYAHDSSSSSSSPAPAALSTIKPLGDWVVRDLEPNEGKRLLLPFLTTRDKLRLSTCCRRLKRYRNYLGQILLRYCPDTAHSKRALSNLLAEQVDLSHLRLTEDSESLMMLVLGWMRGGLCANLKGLTLSDMAYSAADKLEMFLTAPGAPRGLEELHVSFNNYCYDLIFGALADGGCASLKKLRVVPHYDDGFEDRASYMDDEAADLGGVVAKALRSTKLSMLEELELSSIPMIDEDASKIAMALQERTCPALRVLNLSFSSYTTAETFGDPIVPGGLGPSAAEALSQALQANVMPHLEKILLSDNKRLGDEGVKHLVEAITAGALPKLKTLGLCNVGMGREGAKALGRAMMDGCCRNLQDFYFSKNPGIGDAGIVEIAKAMGTAAVPKLEDLVLTSTGVGDEGMKSLGEALQAGGGAMLQTLVLRECGMAEAGGRAIANALMARACPRLVILNLASCSGMGEGSMSDVLKAIGEGCCPELVSLTLSRCGMGKVAGGVLVKAMKSKEWPRLKRLDVEYNEELGDKVGAGIARALEGPAGYKIESLNITEIGLNPMGAGRMAGALERGACPQLTNLYATSLYPRVRWIWSQRLGKRPWSITVWSTHAQPYGPLGFLAFPFFFI